MGPPSTNACDNTAWGGLGARPSSRDDDRPPRPLRRFLKAAVDQLQIQFDASVVTSVQPKSLIAQMREAVADCDDGSSDGSLMLLSPPHDIPDTDQPAGSNMEIEARDADSPVVMTRRVTPANRPLQHLEAGQLGASTPQHVMSRPAVPDLCIASMNLLSLIDPLPLDRLSRNTVAAICSWPAVDRHHILAVANRDVRVAQLYVGRPRGTHRELRVSRRRHRPDVGRITSPSGGGNQSSPGYTHLIYTSL